MTDADPQLRVNGRPYDVRGDRQRTLLHVLREDLGLGGPREGCGIGVCGACTVLMDGRPVSACLILAVQADGRELLTIEGIARDGTLHPVQQAFIDHSAFQCGYCTPGFILTTIALLEEQPSASDEQIRDHLTATLCRCGCYRNILEAVQSMASRERTVRIGPSR